MRCYLSHLKSLNKLKYFQMESFLNKYIFKTDFTVLPEESGGGPMGLGDPNSTKLRKLEITVLIPEMKREIIRTENCKEIWDNWAKCCNKNGKMAIWNCKPDLNLVKECHKKWFYDDEFSKQVTDLYLERRSQYRKTGIGFSVRIDKKVDKLDK